MTRPSSEEGAATVLVAGLLGVVALLVLGLGRVGQAAVQSARADAVADLVALAAVTGDAPTVRRVAAGGGGRVVQMREQSAGRWTVLVQVGPATAVADAAPATDTVLEPR